MDGRSQKSKQKFQQSRSYKRYKNKTVEENAGDIDGSVSLDAVKEGAGGGAGMAHASGAVEIDVAPDVDDGAGLSTAADPPITTDAPTAADPSITIYLPTAMEEEADTPAAVEADTPHVNTTVDIMNTVIDLPHADNTAHVLESKYLVPTPTVSALADTSHTTTDTADDSFAADLSRDEAGGESLDNVNDALQDVELPLSNADSIDGAPQDVDPCTPACDNKHTDIPPAPAMSSEYEEIIYSYDVMRKIDLPESSDDSSDSFAPSILIDRGLMMDSLSLHRLTRIVVFVRQQMSGGGLITADGNEQPPRKRGRKKSGEANPKIKKSDAIRSTASDPRYLHFLKKVCSVGKTDAVKYIKNQQKWLNDRHKRNKAEIPGRRSYKCGMRDKTMAIQSAEYGHGSSGDGNKPGKEAKKQRRKQAGTNSDKQMPTNSNSSIEVRSIEQGAISTNLRILERIERLKCPEFNMVEFEYLVYKYGDDFSRLSQTLGLSIKDSILAYYLHANKRQHISHALLEAIIERDWAAEADRELFVQNFKRHGKKFWRYQIHRSEKDVKLFYRYYVKRGMPGFWTGEERAAFARIFREHKKDWGRLCSALSDKSPQEVKVYYNEYYKRLGARERESEADLDEAAAVKGIVNVTEAIQLKGASESDEGE